MSRFRSVLALTFLLLSTENMVWAQLSEGDRSRLADQIEAAAEHLDPERFPDLEESQSALTDAVEAVDRYFATATDADNKQAWLAYLDLDPLVNAIQSGDSIATIAREAVDLRYRLIGTAPGLELTALQNLRDADENLIEAIRFRDRERSITTLEKQFEAFARKIRELDASPSAEDFAAISAVLGVIESSGQADEFVHSLRDTFSRPNIAVHVGEPMVQTMLRQDVHQQRAVRDCILGTRIIGDASLNGAVTANLLPGVGAARINVTLVGQVISNSFGYNGPVRLRTVGYGDVSAWRIMTVNDSGVHLEPAQANAVLRSDILAIEHKLAIVRKIARKKAAQQKSRADRIAEDKMRRQVRDQFTSRTDEGSAIGTPDILAKFRPVLKRLSLREPSQSWGSTEQAIAIDSTFRRHDQLSAVVSPPPIDQTYDAAVQIHESVIDNAFAPILAGRTLNENRLNDLLEKTGRPTPEPAPTKDADEPPFEIDFARLRPIIFEARDQTLRLGVRGTRFAQGSRELKQAMEITALYEPGTTEDGVAVLLREGDVDVTFPGRKRLTVAQAGLKRTIQKKFSDVFPEVVLDRPYEVPEDAKLKSMRGRKFYPRWVDAQDGWLTITLR